MGRDVQNVTHGPRKSKILLMKMQLSMLVFISFHNYDQKHSRSFSLLIINKPISIYVFIPDYVLSICIYGLWLCSSQYALFELFSLLLPSCRCRSRPGGFLVISLYPFSPSLTLNSLSDLFSFNFLHISINGSQYNTNTECETGRTRKKKYKTQTSNLLTNFTIIL